MTLVEKARDRIEACRATPSMVAGSREAFIAIVATVLDMVLDDFCTWQFYHDNVPKKGCSYLTLGDEVDQAWADKICDAALKLLAEKA